MSKRMRILFALVLLAFAVGVPTPSLLLADEAAPVGVDGSDGAGGPDCGCCH